MKRYNKVIVVSLVSVVVVGRIHLSILSQDEDNMLKQENPVQTVQTMSSEESRSLTELGWETEEEGQ